MNQQYGICMTDCDITDEINNVKRLEITNLVRIMFVNDNEMRCSIKLVNEANGGPKKFGTTIYSCDFKNITVVSNSLFLFLVSTEYWGRLDILRFKKKIENFKVGSKGKLQVMYNACRHFFEFCIQYIGLISTLGEGSFVGINLSNSDFKQKPFLLRQLFRRFHNKNEVTNSLLTVRMEQLFSDFDLPDSFNEYEKSTSILDQTHNRATSSMQQRPEFIKPFKPFILNEVNKYFEVVKAKEMKNLELNEKPEPMEVDNISGGNEQRTRIYQNYNNQVKDRNSLEKLLKALDSENQFVNKTTLRCMGCKNFENIFTFSCSHPFCFICLFGLCGQQIKADLLQCPNCKLILEGNELNKLNHFIEQHVSQEAEQLKIYAEKKSFGRIDKENKSALSVTRTDNKTIAFGFDKLSNNITKIICMVCENSGILFTFPCSHPFCSMCLSEWWVQVKLDQPVKCPICGIILRNDKLAGLHLFINQHVLPKQGKSYDDKKLFGDMDKENKMVSSYTGNKIVELKFDKLDNNITMKCLREGCNEMENLFTLTCNHQFCWKCFCELSSFKPDEKVCCPACGFVLDVTLEQNYSKFCKKEFSRSNNDVKERFTPRCIEGTGNKVEVRKCPSCKTINKYDAIKCSKCTHCLSARNYDSVAMKTE